MKLVQKINQMRRDFDGIYECQGCGNKEQIDGCYDDDYYHTNVTPTIKCKKCGESTESLKLTQPKVETRYSPYQIV